MLKSITFKNYKSFQRKTKLEIKPLTIIVGPNNAGKSSITNLFSMFKQSTSGNYQPNSLFVLDGKQGIDGPLHRIINYKCMVSGKPMDIGIDLDMNPSNSIIEQNRVTLQDKEKSYDSTLQFNYLTDKMTREDRILDEYTTDPLKTLQPGLSEVFNFFDFSNDKCSLHFEIIPKALNPPTFEQKIKFIGGPLNGYESKVMELKDSDYFFTVSGVSLQNIVSVNTSKKVVKKLEMLNKKLMNNIFSLLSINDKEVSTFNDRINYIKKNIDKLDQFGGFSRIGDGILNYHSKELQIEQDMRYAWWERPSYSKDKSDCHFIKIPGWLAEHIITDKKNKDDEPTRYQNFYFNSNRSYLSTPGFDGGRRKERRHNRHTIYEVVIQKYLAELVSLQKIIPEIVLRKNQGRLTQSEEIIITECILHFFYQQMATINAVTHRIVDNIIKKYSNYIDSHFKRVNLVEIRKSSAAASYNRKEMQEFIGAPAWLFTDDISIPVNPGNPYSKKVVVNAKSVITAVNNDLRSMGINFDLKLEKFGPRTAIDIDKKFSFLLKNYDNQSFGLHEVGYGLSQLIPLLIRKNYFSMINKINSTTIIREPEANIHPSMQAKLASNIVATLKNDYYRNNVIVETHSEHFIRGVQIAVAKGDIKNSDVNILYVNQSRYGNSTIKKIELEEKGRFKSDYPKGFFESGFKEVVELQKLQRL